jgi:DNA-binding GntR family transcriptional regulator
MLDCRFEPGEPLRIDYLCTLVEANQGAVREALSRLTAEYLIEARPHCGFRVAPMSADDLRDLTAARIGIELLCLRRAINAADLYWEARITAAFYQLSRTPKLQPEGPRRLDRRFVALYRSFLDVLVSSCESKWLARLRRLLQDQELRYHGRLPRPAPGDRDLVAELHQVMEAAIARDADHACRLLAIHLQRSAEELIARSLVSLGVSPAESSGVSRLLTRRDSQSTSQGASMKTSGPAGDVL